MSLFFLIVSFIDLGYMLEQFLGVSTLAATAVATLVLCKAPTLLNSTFAKKAFSPFPLSDRDESKNQNFTQLLERQVQRQCEVLSHKGSP